MWPMSLLFIKTFPVKQYSYENDFCVVFDALHQSSIVHSVPVTQLILTVKIPEIPYESLTSHLKSIS